MRNAEYARYKQAILRDGINEWCDAGYYFLDLSQKQFNEIIDIAVSQGCTASEDGWVTLINGLRLKKH